AARCRGRFPGSFDDGRCADRWRLRGDRSGGRPGSAEPHLRTQRHLRDAHGHQSSRWGGRLRACARRAGDPAGLARGLRVGPVHRRGERKVGGRFALPRQAFRPVLGGQRDPRLDRGGRAPVAGAGTADGRPPGGL
ncbi:MAG: hypothetical protein AVDCRST_MAG04-601, partial [uncultured Acetobacteraceae bacterium]